MDIRQQIIFLLDNDTVARNAMCAMIEAALNLHLARGAADGIGLHFFRIRSLPVKAPFFDASAHVA